MFHLGKIAPLSSGAGIIILVAGILLIAAGIVMLVVLLRSRWTVTFGEINSMIRSAVPDEYYDPEYDEKRLAAAERLSIDTSEGAACADRTGENTEQLDDHDFCTEEL